MNYVYDIVLNFQPIYYDFYEWLPSDKIINLKKLPIYKISHEDYLNIKSYNTTIDKNTILTQNKIFLITSGFEVTGILIDNNGKVLKKSSLLFEESDDILENKEELKLRKINYTINHKTTNKLESRSSREKKSYINKYLKKINIEKDKYLLKYLYYDINNIDEENIDKIYNDLLFLSNNNPSKLYDAIKRVELELRH